MRDGEPSYRSLVDGSPLGILVIRADSTILFANPAAAGTFGYGSAVDLIGQSTSCLVAPDEEARLAGYRAARLRDEPAPSRYEVLGLRKDGTPVWLDALASRADWDGQPALVVTVCDITDRKQAEEALHLRDRAIEAISEGILITDPSQPDNPIIYANPAFERITGYAGGEVMGRNCRFLQGRDTDPEAVAAIRAAVAEARPFSGEILNYGKDGTAFWNALALSPIRDVSGRVTHFVGVLSDVTDRRQLQEQFWRGQKLEAVGRLAGGVAHDFNNLLTVITGRSHLLLNRVTERGAIRRDIELIDQTAERAALLTRQLLAFGRRQVLQPQVLDLNEVVTGLATLLRRLIREDIELVLRPGPGLGRVKADPGQLEQVVTNLAVNARDAMPNGGRLTLEMANVDLDDTFAGENPGARVGRYVMLAVSDTGVGFDEETRSRIFEPFFTTKEVGKGTGLGLAMVYGVVKQHEGYITLESARDEGATFRIYLPLVEDPARAGGPGAGLPSAERGSATVLLVEDQDDVRDVAAEILEVAGYTVLPAGTPGEALIIAQKHAGPIDLLVTDVIMPQMNGRELAERLSTIRPDMKVLYISGYADDAIIRHGVLGFGIPMVSKPFSPDALARKVREVLGAS